MILTFRFRDGTRATSTPIHNGDYPIHALVGDFANRRLNETHYVDSAGDHGRRLEFRLYEVAEITITP